LLCRSRSSPLLPYTTLFRSPFQAKQWFFGSEEREVNGDEHLEIKINPRCLSLDVVSVVLVLMGGMSGNLDLKPIFLLVGLIGMVATSIYAMKSWFIFE